MKINVFVMVLSVFGFASLFVFSSHYTLSKKEWSCVKSAVVDNDITKVECIAYMRNDFAEMNNENSN